MVIKLMVLTLQQKLVEGEGGVVAAAVLWEVMNGAPKGRHPLAAVPHHR